MKLLFKSWVVKEGDWGNNPNFDPDHIGYRAWDHVPWVRSSQNFNPKDPGQDHDPAALTQAPPSNTPTKSNSGGLSTDQLVAKIQELELKIQQLQTQLGSGIRKAEPEWPRNNRWDNNQ